MFAQSTYYLVSQTCYTHQDEQFRFESMKFTNRVKLSASFLDKRFTNIVKIMHLLHEKRKNTIKYMFKHAFHREHLLQ